MQKRVENVLHMRRRNEDNYKYDVSAEKKIRYLVKKERCNVLERKKCFVEIDLCRGFS